MLVRVIVTSALVASAIARADTRASDDATPAPAATPSADTRSPDPSLTTAAPVAATPMIAPAEPPPAAPRDTKSAGLAAALSATPTLVGIGLVGVGLYVANRPQECTGDPGVPPFVMCKDHFPLGRDLMIAGGVLLAVGPSLGHIYNGRAWTTGLKLRLIGTGISALGLGIVAVAPRCDDFICAGDAIGLLTMVGGAGTFVVGAAVDMATAHGAVETRNAQLSLSRFRTPSGSAPALVLNMTF